MYSGEKLYQAAAELFSLLFVFVEESGEDLAGSPDFAEGLFVSLHVEFEPEPLEGLLV